MPSSVAAGNTVQIFDYYGNPTAKSESNGNKVFDLFDNFNEASLNTTIWADISSGTASVSLNGTVAKLTPDGTNRAWLESVANFTNNFILEARAKEDLDGSIMLTIKWDGTHTSSYDQPTSAIYIDTYGTAKVKKASQTTVTTIGTITVSSLTSWNIFGFAYYNDSIKIFEDGTLIYQNSSITAPSYNHLGIGSREKTASTYLDWVRVRKYVLNPPTVAVSTSEEANLLTVTINFEDSNGTPLTGVQLLVNNQSQTVLTSSISLNLTPGVYFFKATKEGFQEVTLTKNITADTTFTITLTPLPSNTSTPSSPSSPSPTIVSSSYYTILDKGSSTDYILANDSSTLHLQSFTIIVLGRIIKLPSTFEWLFTKSSDIWCGSFSATIETNGMTTFRVEAPQGSALSVTSTAPVFTPGNAFMVTYEKNATAMTIYKGLSEVGHLTTSSTTIYYTTGALKFLSKASNGSIELYEVLIYNRGLSPSEREAIYMNPLNPPKTGLILEYLPSSINPTTGTWSDVSGNGNDASLSETNVPISIPALSVYDSLTQQKISLSNLTITLLSNNASNFLIPSLIALPYNETVLLNITAPGYLARTIQFSTPITSLSVYLQPVNQSTGINIQQAVNVTGLIKNVTSWGNITPINGYAKAFIDSGGSFGDTIKLSLEGDSLMRLVLPQVLILAIVIIVLVQTTSPLAALAGALIGWAMTLGILGEAPSLRNSSLTFMLIVFLVAWTLWDLFYNYSRET